MKNSIPENGDQNVPEQSAPPKAQGRPALMLGAFFAPSLLPWIVLYRVVRSGGWKRALFTISLIGNLFCLVAVLAAGHLADEEADCGPEVLAKLPYGFTCHPQDPLYFAELPLENEMRTVLPPTMFVCKDGRHVASFAFGERYDELVSADLYDSSGRSRISFDPATGSASYTVYTDGMDPDVSFRDADGDGTPDWKIDWESNTSFERCAEVSWCAAAKPSKPSEE